MSNKIRRIDYYPDEMIAGVAGKLQAVDFGIYWMICTLIYSRGGSIDNDHIWMSRIFHKTHWRVVRASIDRLIEAGKVQETDGQLMVVRCFTELLKARKRIASGPQEHRKSIARASQDGPVSKENNDISKPSTNNHQPPTSNHQPSIDKSDKPAKRASRLPADWQPCESAINYARKKGFSENEIHRLCEDIVDWSRSSKNGAKLDWLATWQTWVRRRVDERGSSSDQSGRGSNGAGQSHAAGNRSGPGGVVAALDQLQGRNPRSGG